jgi:hypothetical protein
MRGCAASARYEDLTTLFAEWRSFTGQMPDDVKRMLGR